MPLPFLRTASGAYDRAAIMRRAWTRACNSVTRSTKAGHAANLRQASATALRATWDEARGAPSNALWRAEQDRQAEALATLAPERSPPFMPPAAVRAA